jgi:hypothetical protein
MLVLKANESQYNALNGYTFGVSELLFVKDGANNWIVGTDVLNDHNFIRIREQLNELKQIEYIETIINND